jgi:hypothetical protein
LGEGRVVGVLVAAAPDAFLLRLGLHVDAGRCHGGQQVNERSLHDHRMKVGNRMAFSCNSMAPPQRAAAPRKKDGEPSFFH